MSVDLLALKRAADNIDKSYRETADALALMGAERMAQAVETARKRIEQAVADMAAELR